MPGSDIAHFVPGLAGADGHGLFRASGGVQRRSVSVACFCLASAAVDGHRTAIDDRNTAVSGRFADILGAAPFLGADDILKCVFQLSFCSTGTGRPPFPRRRCRDLWRLLCFLW
eukprot:2314419-Rhodomonas_salina.1